jgi:photosystem II stability/assembly factor-like uncharacterized protein
MQRLTLILVVLFHLFNVSAQYPINSVKPSSDKVRLEVAEKRSMERSKSIYTSIKSKNIGPTIMSGRVVDVAVNPNNSKHFFVAYATGGVWETKNNGQSFAPIFDNNGLTNNCGALAVNWSSQEIYVGTGEANSSRSSYAGLGVFKSSFSNGTYSWEHLGLEGTQHIARILIDPADKNTIFVAAIGNLFSTSKARGVYKSGDGGKTWKQTLYISENTGVIDMEFNPENSQQLIASSWEKSRRAWNFWEGGPESGIYISQDGGESWNVSTTFLSSENVGRIGLTTATGGVVYALVDNQEEFEKPEKRQEGIEKKVFLEMTVDSFMNLSDSTLNAFLKKNGFPKKHDAKNLKKQIRKREIEPKLLYDYLTDSNADLFDKNVKGAELYRSNDFGQTWKRTHNEVLERVCYTYGYYFGTVQVNPTYPSQVYIAGVPLLKSSDHGKNFSFVGGDNVHVDHHYVWINPNDSNHLINGNDGGINISYDGGENWIKCNSPAVGQFYTVAVSQKENYYVYGGLQDNGVWEGSPNYKASSYWHQEGRYPYRRLLGGDGMRIEIDDQGSIYTGYQFGHYYRIDKNGKRKYIHPKHELKEDPLRWNWQTPILLSSHNQQILYMGSNKLHRSMDRGETFEAISDDLTNGSAKGDVSYGTLTDISESPLKFGLIYTGSDDGKVFCTQDGGNNWLDRSDGLPKGYWVKRVVASRHVKSKVYLILNGHNWDNTSALIYCSEDFGETWKQLGKDLPEESLNVIREDVHNTSRIYVGSDAGLMFSSDCGGTFQTLSDLPVVPVHDLTINEVNNDLLIATHGRSLYKVELQCLNLLIEYQDSGLTVFSPEEVEFNNIWGERSYNWNILQPQLMLDVVVADVAEVVLKIKKEDETLFTHSFVPRRGINQLKIPVKFNNRNNPYPKKGTYQISVSEKDQSDSTSWIIK